MLQGREARLKPASTGSDRVERECELRASVHPLKWVAKTGRLKPTGLPRPAELTGLLLRPIWRVVKLAGLPVKLTTIAEVERTS